MNFRPRFSLRTLLVLVTLVGLYLGCWEVTKRFGLKPTVELPEIVTAFVLPKTPFDSSPAPFVISREDYREQSVVTTPPSTQGKVLQQQWLGMSTPQVFVHVREYHFWFFGFTAKLPFERDLGTVTQQSRMITTF